MDFWTRYEQLKLLQLDDSLLIKYKISELAMSNWNTKPPSLSGRPTHISELAMSNWNSPSFWKIKIATENFWTRYEQLKLAYLSYFNQNKINFWTRYEQLKQVHRTDQRQIYRQFLNSLWAIETFYEMEYALEDDKFLNSLWAIETHNIGI